MANERHSRSIDVRFTVHETANDAAPEAAAGGAVVGPARFQRDEAVTKAVPRIGRSQAKKAMRKLGSSTNPRQRVHEARTYVKKLRALLRLVEPALGKVYRREDERLRELGRTLSGLRDAEVLIETFDGLFEHFEEQLGPPLRRARTRLTTRLRNVESRIDVPARLREAEEAFRKTRKRARRWVPEAGGGRGGWKAIVGGLGATYRWGRRAMESAYRAADDRVFHDWRKAVKYHGYHMRLLAEIWPEELNGRLEALERLGDLLGEDHDLVGFAETLRTEPRCFENERDREVLLGLIEQRKAALRAMAQPLGKRLYAEQPSAYCRRLHRYWKVWRNPKDARASELARTEAATPAAPAASHRAA
jgi:CHAD domain-containing protein